MTTRTADRVDEWDARPFSDGYEELRTLADRSFSGAITAGRATLYMLNGTVVGVLDGSIEDFEDATGTVYEAPTAALPLLAVMQERSDEVRAKYYSEETALADADGKLSEGGFTGYVELSENVLSGDYYVVYHGGKSMSVAYVGESERLITDEEAFERADEEVGIYEVRPVEVEPIEIPEPEPEEDDETSATAAAESNDGESGADEHEETDSASATTTSTAAESSTRATKTADEADDHADSEAPSDADAPAGGRADDTEQASERASERSSERGSDQRSTTSGDDSHSTARGSGEERTHGSTAERTRGSDRESGAPADEDAGRSPDSGSRRSRRDSEPRQSQRSEPRHSPRDDRERRDRREDQVADEQPPERRQSRSVDEGRRTSENRPRGSQEPVTESRSKAGSPERDRRERGRQSEQSAVTDRATEVAEQAISEESSGDTAELERRTIPSVDPDRTWTPDGSDSDQSQPAQSTAQPPRETQTRRSAPGGRESEVSAELDAAQSEIDELERRLDELETERADLEADRDELAAERDQLQAELDRVRAERDELQAEVEDLRQQLAEREQRAAPEDTVTAETTLSPAQAIDGTNLFVRYESKGDATLKSAHDGSADADAVDANLNLEYHTGFDADETAVDGQPFEDFLVETIHYRFVDWVVRKLLYEIRDTGHQSELADLYDALPLIDRAELNGSVSIAVTEDGEEQRTQEHFDVVLRDRMGNPLIVTNLNDSREAATDEMMTELVTAATRVGESSDHLAGAFFVTSSFFDPDALETAAEASGGGILSRDKRESFVRLSRKDGFHLCLVESRDGGFHLAVPEL